MADVTIDLCGETLRVHEVEPDDLQGPMMRFAEAMESESDMVNLAGCMRMLRFIVVDADQGKINALFDRRTGAPRVKDVDGAIAQAFERFFARPTQPSSPSASGQESTPTRSRVVSLSRGTGEAAPPSPQAGLSDAG